MTTTLNRFVLHTTGEHHQLLNNRRKITQHNIFPHYHILNIKKQLITFQKKSLYEILFITFHS